MQTNSTLVGIDLGFGYTKALAEHSGEGNIAQFPSVIGLAENIRYTDSFVDGQAASAGIHLHTDAGPRFVGQHALDQARVNWNANDKRRTDRDTLTLLYAALSELDVAGDIILGTGLPVEWYDTAAVRHTTKLLLGEHRIRREGRPDQHVRIIEVQTMMQPFGSLAYIAFKEDGTIQNGAILRNQVAVIDPGRYTTDWLVAKGGTYIEPLSGHCTIAMSRIYELARNAIRDRFDYLMTIEAVDLALRRGYITPRGQKHLIGDLVEPIIRGVSDSIVARIATKWGEHSDDIDTIFVTAGGGPMLGPYFRDRFVQIAMLPEEISAVANAVGYLRYLKFLRRKKLLKTADLSRQNGRAPAGVG